MNNGAISSSGKPIKKKLEMFKDKDRFVYKVVFSGKNDFIGNQHSSRVAFAYF